MPIIETVRRLLGHWRPRRSKHESEWDTDQTDLLARFKQGMHRRPKRRLP